MRMSQLVGKRKKERPSEAVLESHAFLLRGAYVHQVGSGLFSLFHPAVRCVKVRRASFHADPPRTFYADGEPLMDSRASPPPVEIWPGALRVIASAAPSPPPRIRHRCCAWPRL